MAPKKNGAVDEARTRDLHLGKVALYQLSYYRMECALGRNRTTDTVIFSHMLYRLSYQGIMATRKGARTLDLQRDRPAHPTSYGAGPSRWEQQGSNL